MSKKAPSSRRRQNATQSRKRSRKDPGIPATFPTEDQYSDRDEVPAFVLYACYGAGRFISDEKWSKLTERQAQFVTDSLASRGFVLIHRKGGMATILKSKLDQPAEFRMANPGIDFYIEDVRFDQCHDIWIHVNESSMRRAKTIVRRFLQELAKTGFVIN